MQKRLKTKGRDVYPMLAAGLSELHYLCSGGETNKPRHLGKSFSSIEAAAEDQLDRALSYGCDLAEIVGWRRILMLERLCYTI